MSELTEAFAEAVAAAWKVIKILDRKADLPEVAKTMTYPQVDGITPTVIDWTKHETQTGGTRIASGNPAFPLGGKGNYSCTNHAEVNR